MIRLLVFVLLFIPVAALAQRDFLVVIEGNTLNLRDKKAVFGVAIDVMQQDAVLTKVLSDQNGNFFVSAKIAQGTPIKLRLTKGGYQTKFILIDLTTLQNMPNVPNGLQLLRQLDCELYELRPDVDLSFSKDQITDKYVWTAGALAQVPLIKSDADQKALAAYQLALDNKRYNNLLQATNKALAVPDQDRALLFLDSMLVLRPSDQFATQKKQQILTEQAAALKKSQDEAKQKALLNEAVAAREANDLKLAETKIKEADAVLANNSEVLQEQKRIAQLITEANDAKSKNEAFQNAMKAAAALVTAKKYDAAEAKYLEAQQIKPSEKETVNTQLTALKELKFDIQNEIELKKTLKLANDQFVLKKYDLSLETYKKADAQIALFHKQSLIDSYSKELQAGMKRVTDGINSMSQVYQDQLAKANENFNKGPQFYGTAKSILNSDPMKSRQNEPEVIELKDKITAMEAYYKEKREAYQFVKAKDNPAALKALEKVQKSGQSQVQHLQVSELPALQNSIDSLRAILNPVKTTQVKPDVAVEPVGIRLSAPGEEVSGENSMAFNDLQLGRDAKKEQPYRTQQQIRNEVEYQNYFTQQSAQVGSFETTAQLEMTRAQREVQARQNAIAHEQMQANKDQSNQQYEVAVRDRTAATEVRQQETTENLREWKDAKDYQEQTVAKEASLRQESELSRLNKFQNELELQDQQQPAIDEQNVNELNKRSQVVEYSKEQQLSSATNSGQAQYEKIQQTAEETVQLKTTPNYLRDENGVLFAKNSMTEKTYQLKNKEGYITKVIIRRVVVDPNGYGVVYEQITDENGKTYFTRDGQVSTEYIWFNESTGANVLIK